MIKDKLVNTFFGNVIEAKVKERLRAASVTDDEDMTGWRKLTGNINRDLSPLKQERMCEIAFWLWENTPMGQWLIDVAKDFVLAEGLPYEAKNKDVKTVLDDFWYDPLNRMDLYLEKHVRELFIFGELCFPAFVAEQTGRLRLGYVDPVQISKVVTDPENIKMMIGVVLKGSSGADERKLKTILPADADSILSPKAQEMRKSYADGQCFFFAINNLTNSPRGRSELLAVADWLDNYEQFLFDLSDKWRQINAFLWDLKVDGGDDNDIKKQVDNVPKKPGSVYGHNEKIELKAATPTLNSLDISEAARLFRNHILGSKCLPEHWYGGGGDVNRATAVEMGTPTFKTLSSKQRYFKFILESILEFQIDMALEKRYLIVPEDEAYDYSVITPELASKDLGKYATVISQITTALAQATLNRWIDEATAQKIFGQLIGYLGIEVDLEEMRKAIEAEKKNESMKDYL